MIKKVLAAVDGSDHSIKAVEYASDIAQKYDAKIYLIHVISKAVIPPDYLKYAKVEKIEDSPDSLLFTRIAEQILNTAEEIARKKGVKNIRKVVKQGNPADEITRFAKEKNVDWVFLGSRGLGSLKEMLLGSVSNKVCQMAESTCITVK